MSVDGGWSSWTSFSSCPVTCGVGLQVSDRKCNNPTAKHGGQPCPGEQRRSKICKTNVHCPGTRQTSIKLESKQSLELKYFTHDLVVRSGRRVVKLVRVEPVQVPVRWTGHPLQRGARQSEAAPRVSPPRSQRLHLQRRPAVRDTRLLRRHPVLP